MGRGRQRLTDWLVRRGRRIRFGDAVPLRSDRRELRRRLRRAARAAKAEHHATTMATLTRLEARRVLVLRVSIGAGAADDVLDFADGTRLYLRIRDGNGAMRRLTRHVPDSHVHIKQAIRCFGGSWFRLQLTSSDSGEVVELLTTVVPLQGIMPRSVTSGRRRWHRHLSEQ